jgi:hypothetical protein
MDGGTRAERVPKKGDGSTYFPYENHQIPLKCENNENNTSHAA